MKDFIKEFKAFIKRGNVIDLAVAVVIGGAFGKIVSSLVDDIIMPLIAAIIGKTDFSNLTLELGESTIKYGSFVQNVVDFLIIAFFVFLIVKVMNKFTKKEEHKNEEPKKNDEVLLLEDIRDLLKKQK